jgi:hypothetical protein
LQCRWKDATNLYREISWEMGAINPKATYTTQELASCPMDTKENSVVQILCRYEEQATVNNKMYHYDVLNGLGWTLGYHGMSLEADIIMNEALKQMKRMVIPGYLEETNFLMEDVAEVVQGKMLGLWSITDYEMEATARTQSVLHGPDALGFFDVIGRIITHQCRAPKSTAMLIDIVTRKLCVLSARQETGMTALQLLGTLHGIKSFEQAKSIVVPKMIYERILQGANRLETLEILSLLAEELLRIGKFDDANQVATRVLVGYKMQYGAKHPETLQSQLRVAMTVPLPYDNE